VSDEQHTPAEAAVTLEETLGGLSVHVYGAADLPAGTVITFTITIGPGGALAVAPPAAVPAQKPYMGRRINE
jgi:hypothetical protein